MDASFGGVHVAEGGLEGGGIGGWGELGYEVTEFSGDVDGFGVVFQGDVFGLFAEVDEGCDEVFDVGHGGLIRGVIGVLRLARAARGGCRPGRAARRIGG